MRRVSASGFLFVRSIMVSPTVHERLVRAIREKRLIGFDYKDTTGRVVEPHDYGVKGNAECALVYQITGQSRTGASHGWKMFTVSAMANLHVLHKTFAGSRAMPSQHHIHWDRLFARVER